MAAIKIKFEIISIPKINELKATILNCKDDSIYQSEYIKQPEQIFNNLGLGINEIYFQIGDGSYVLSQYKLRLELDNNIFYSDCETRGVESEMNQQPEPFNPEWDNSRFIKECQGETTYYEIYVKGNASKLMQFQVDDKWYDANIGTNGYRLNILSDGKCKDVSFRVKGDEKETWGCIEACLDNYKIEFITECQK